MPISAMEHCSPAHWEDVRSIIRDCGELEGFEVLLVSEGPDTGIIQKRIVQNLYFCEIVVCDVSCRNPNVMLELGMRLAFDKPVIAVKDDVTDYSFDTSPLDHLAYPRDLRFPSIIKFKEELRQKLRASKTDDNARSFLKSFGDFETVQLHSREIPAQEYLTTAMDQLRIEVASIKAAVGTRIPLRDAQAKTGSRFRFRYLIHTRGDQKDANFFATALMEQADGDNFKINEKEAGVQIISGHTMDHVSEDGTRKLAKSYDLEVEYIDIAFMS